MGHHHCDPPLPRLLRDQLTPTIAQTNSPIGRQAGLWAKRSGAAEFTGRAAPIREEDVRPSAPPRLPMIAMLDLPTGCMVGLYQRKHGAAKIVGRAALPRLGAALE